MLERFTLLGFAPKLEGERVYLRPHLQKDWAAWSRLRAESRDFLKPWEPAWPDDALSRPAFRRRLRRLAQEARDDQAYSFLIFRRDDNLLLGGITLSHVRRGVSQTGAVGYWLGHFYCGQGYMTEALKLIVRFAFGELSLRRLEAACLPHNGASRAILRKCGFREEGYAREYLRIDGQWQDHILFAVLRSDPHI